MDAGEAVVLRGRRRQRAALAAGLVALACAGVAAAVVHVSIAGRWQGLFLLRAKDGAALELKDDLVLGDGSRVLAGVSFSRARRLLLGAAPASGPWLELEWSEDDGSGIVRNHLADGSELVTLFSRYEESDGGEPHGLFVGGALPEVAADASLQNESGMSFHDARGWTHVWCNVNEAVYDPDLHRLLYPSQLRFLGSRVLVHDRRRVVLESAHEIPFARGPVRMERYAYFTAGEPFFKLGIRLVNLAEQDVGYSYAYGDEPWVGTFGSAEGNVGWTVDGRFEVEGSIDARARRWAGILDAKSGVANFVSWVGEDLPDLVYFSNHPGTFRPAAERVPLDSNEVFIGLQWDGRQLHPGESRSMLLSLGIAEEDPARRLPRLPAGAGPPEPAP